MLELAAIPSPNIEPTIPQDSPRVRFKDSGLEDETSDGGSESDGSEDDRSDSSDSYDEDSISCNGEASHIPFASLSVTDKSSNMGSTKKDKKKKGSCRSLSDGYNVFDSLNIDEAPIAQQQIIDGSVQALYKGLYEGKDMGYHVLFHLEVPASITKKRVFAEVIDDGMTLAITTYYSPNLLHQNRVMLEAFGNFSYDSTGAESWRNSCDEITHRFPTDRIPNYVVKFPLITRCRMDPSDIQVKVQLMTHHDEDQQMNDQNEVHLFVKLRSVAKVHEKNEVEESDKVADISTITNGRSIPTAQNQQMQAEIDALKQLVLTLQNQQQQSSSSSSGHYGMSSYSSKPIENQNEMTYRRNTTPLQSVPTLQDPLASGSRKGAKSIIEMSSSVSSKVASGAYNILKDKYYNAVKNVTEESDDSMSDL